MESILKLDHIQKYYGNEGNITKAIQDISFSVSKGEFLGIMGASGSGKTTLLNCISTIDTVSAGHIYLEGTDVTELPSKSLARFRRENFHYIAAHAELIARKVDVVALVLDLDELLQKLIAAFFHAGAQ